MIAVHAGAGCHPDGIDKLCRDVVRSANGDIVEAIKMFENDPRTNCGFGSNFSLTGKVQCEAAYMTSKDQRFGAVAAVSTIRNPIVAARQLVVNQIKRRDSTLIAPSILVGEGAEKYAADSGIDKCSPEDLKSSQAEKIYEKALQKLVISEDRLDTVGAVAIDRDGTSSAGISSGGIILKFDGRLGHSSQFGGGVWAEQRGGRSVAVTTSGCGEALARTHFAEKLGESLLEYDTSGGLFIKAVNETFQRGFLENPRVVHSFIPDHRLAGGVALISDEDDGIAEAIIFHNTQHFAFAYSDGTSVKRGLSQLEDGAKFSAKSYPLRL